MPSFHAFRLGALAVVLASSAAAQAIDLVLVVGDAETTQELRLGLDPSATAGIDAALGEAELPPLPPSGVFEARFVNAGTPAALGQGSYRDYRPGAAGVAVTSAHALQWQLGAGASAFRLAYDLPAGVSVAVEDVFGGVVVRETLVGAGELRVTNGGITQVRLTASYPAANVAPAFTSAPVTAGQVGAAYTYAVTASDSDGDALTISAPTLPGWLALADAGDGTATLSGTPAAAGRFAVVLRASDGAAAVEQAFTVEVAERPNAAPTFTSVPTTAAQAGAGYTYAVTAADPDGDALAISAPTLPPWLALADAGDGTATLSGTPPAEGDASVVLRASDGTATVEQRFTIAVTAAPVPRVAVTARVVDGAGPLAGVTVSVEGSGTATAETGADGTAVFDDLPAGGSFAVTARLDGATFVPATFSLPALTASTAVTFVRSAGAGSGAVSFEATGEVGPEGGTLPFADGGRLEVPPGAVAEGTTLFVGTFDAPPPGVVPAGPLFYFGPAGVTFAAPVTLRVPYSEADVPAGTAEADLRLVRFDEATGAYAVVTPATVDTEANVITATVTGFSGYGAALPEAVATDDEPDARASLGLPSPNPSAASVRIGYALASAGPVRLALYDGLGRRVALLAEGPHGPGAHEATAVLAGLPAGVYLLRLETEAGARTRTLTIVQ